jgi:hypothetical protein
VADVGRITELWREAADALELEPLHVALQQALLGVRAERAEAECGRLREQLKRIAALDDHPTVPTSDRGDFAIAIARAALGVEGGQVQHGE